MSRSTDGGHSQLDPEPSLPFSRNEPSESPGGHCEEHRRRQSQQIDPVRGRTPSSGPLPQVSGSGWRGFLRFAQPPHCGKPPFTNRRRNPSWLESKPRNFGWKDSSIQLRVMNSRSESHRLEVVPCLRQVASLRRSSRPTGVLSGAARFWLRRPRERWPRPPAPPQAVQRQSGLALTPKRTRSGPTAYSEPRSRPKRYRAPRRPTGSSRSS
jgi:hypothetical protein